LSDTGFGQAFACICSLSDLFVRVNLSTSTETHRPSCHASVLLAGIHKNLAALKGVDASFRWHGRP